MSNSQAQTKPVAWDKRLGANIEFRRKRIAAIASRPKFSAQLQAIGCHLSVDQIGDIERGDRACSTEELHYIALALNCHEDDLKPAPLTGRTMTLEKEIQAALKAQDKAATDESVAPKSIMPLLKKTAIAVGVTEKTITETIDGQLVFSVQDVLCSLFGSERGITLKVNNRVAERFAHPDQVESSLPAFKTESLKSVLVQAIASAIARTKMVTAETTVAELEATTHE